MKFKVGDTVTKTKTFTKEEVALYAMTCEDSNPIHLDEAYASKTYYQKPIVHGLLSASLFGGLLGSVLPGKGTIHLSQQLIFLKPIYIGEKVVAIIEITHIRSDKPILTFKCSVLKEDKSCAIEGEAKVMYKGEFFN